MTLCLLHLPSQICREAEAAIFHQQLFEELRRLTPLSSDPTEVTAIGAVESSFKCCAGAIIVLTTSGRWANHVNKRPDAEKLARHFQAERQSSPNSNKYEATHIHHNVCLVVNKKAANRVKAADASLCNVNFVPENLKKKPSF